MATALAVTGNTSQAVGAFNALASSINNANAGFARLQGTMAGVGRVASNTSNYVTAINSSFARLQSAMSTVYSVALGVGAGIQFVFSSLLRELDKLQGFNAIMSVTTKSADAAAASYDFLRRTADTLGLRFDDLAGNYAKLVAALPPGIKGIQTAEKAFMGLSMAARTLHATNADTQLMFYAVTQMASKGVVSMEELRRQLGEKLPGAMQIAAKAVNTIPEELEKAIRKGVVSSEKFIPLFSDALIRAFSESSQKASESVSAAMNRLKNVWVDFSKEVLDSGAGQAIVGLFDALREKLSDPYLISRFAELVKDLATRFTEFIQRLTADDIRNGFDTMAKGIDLLVRLVDKLIQALTWVINNAGQAGAILGGVMGASVGVLGGPVGMAAGFAGGAMLGGAAGNALMPTKADNDKRAASDLFAKQQKAMDDQQKEMLKLYGIIPMLQNFKGLSGFKGIEKLTTAEMANTKTLVDLNRILTGKEYKTDADKATAVKEYAKYGVVVGPNNATLKDIIGGDAKGKKSAAEKSEDATYLKAFGLDANFTKEFDNLISLYKKGRLNIDQYTGAVDALIQKQPYMEASVRAATEAEKDANKFRQEALDVEFKRIEVKERLRESMVDEMRFATMRSEDARLEGEVLRNMYQYIEAGISIKEGQLAQWREEIRLRTRLQELTQIGESITNATIDKYQPAIKQQQAMDLLVANPNSGFTEQNAQDFTVNSDPNMQGSTKWIETQRRQLEEYYAYIDMLRGKDRISEESATLAKARAGAEYNKIKMQQTTDLFDTLASLSNSGNRKLAAVGKAAAIANATIKAYEAINVALALPYPMNYVQAAAVGLQAFANIRAIQSQGFQAGGYTGNGGESQVAGVVHGKEFVANAGATRRNRAVLEAMNAGATIGGGSANVSVVVNNNSSGTQVRQTERDTPDGKQIEVTIEDVVVKSVKRGGRVADALQEQYGLNRAVGVR